MAIVLEVPMAPKERGSKVAEGFRCEQLMPDGRLCGRPVREVRARECYRHFRWDELLPPLFQIPFPWDAVCIHEILAKTMAYVIRKELTPQQARVIVLAVREMRQNLWAFQREDGW